MTPPRLEFLPGLWIDSRLALWLAGPRLLVVADLHWGYVESHRARGNLLPAWGDADIAQRLSSLVADYQPAEIIWLGDSLHTLDGHHAADAFLRNAHTPVTLIGGNHDARWSHAANRTSVIRDRFYFHHGDRPDAHQIPAGHIEVIGHFHPALALTDAAGTHLKLPALVVSPRRLILPAFSPWAAGMPWHPDSPDEIVYGIGTKRIFTVSPVLHQKQPFRP